MSEDALDLAAWLLVQIAEDKRRALALEHRSDPEGGDLFYACPERRTEPYGDLEWGLGTCDCGLAVRQRRALAECEAKRRIIELAQDATSLDVQVDGEFRVGPRDETAEPYVGDLVLRALALPYADRPGYREDWRSA